MRRRELLKAGAAATLVTSGAESSTCSETERKGTFVLVHGANHGGWCWRLVREALQARSFSVYTPTLTGLGDRSHLVSPEISLQDHIEDVVNTIRAEELQDIVLVGHSYGGTVITGVCDVIKDRISQVIYLDANTPGDGEATIPNLSKEMAEKAVGHPLQDGYLVPPLDPIRLGIDPQDQQNIDWLQRRLTAHPIATLSEPLKLNNGGSEGLRRTFILTTQRKFLQPFALQKLAATQADESWNYRELMVGHDAMITAPCEVTDLLVEIAEHY